MLGSLRHWLFGAAVGIAAAAPSAAQEGGKVEVLWLGQAAMRITTPAGKVILVDPWISKNPKSPEQYKSLEALDASSTKVFPINPGDKLTF